mmetsp:Transcript_1537/g.2623  ORF Transcript_1537/g.2623 Transcript_1537/m.2623 type:complete len:247 (-) Transcript_1537:13-753(-)
MRILAVHGDTEDLAVQVFELVVAVAEGRDFSRTYEGEVQRIEKQKHVFLTDVGGQLRVDELLVEDSSGLEVGCRVADQRQCSIHSSIPLDLRRADRRLHSRRSHHGPRRSSVSHERGRAIRIHHHTHGHASRLSSSSAASDHRRLPEPKLMCTCSQKPKACHHHAHKKHASQPQQLAPPLLLAPRGPHHLRGCAANRKQTLFHCQFKFRFRFRCVCVCARVCDLRASECIGFRSRRVWRKGGGGGG